MSQLSSAYKLLGISALRNQQNDMVLHKFVVRDG